jgi:hypothetical protein
LVAPPLGVSTAARDVEPIVDGPCLSKNPRIALVDRLVATENHRHPRGALVYKQIARELSKRNGKEISELTVRTHVGDVAWKMGRVSGGNLGVMAEISRRARKFP